jgi:hypothetical protein
MLAAINPLYKAEILLQNGWSLKTSTTYPGQYYWYKWSIDRSVWDSTSRIYIDDDGQLIVIDNRMSYAVSAE